MIEHPEFSDRADALALNDPPESRLQEGRTGVKPNCDQGFSQS